MEGSGRGAVRGGFPHREGSVSRDAFQPVCEPVLILPPAGCYRGSPAPIMPGPSLAAVSLTPVIAMTAPMTDSPARKYNPLA